jgi:hypothetical protein
MISIRCAECQCVQQDCIKVDVESCILCTRGICCCDNIHNNNNSRLRKPLGMAKVIITTREPDECCVLGSCESNNNALQRKATTTSLSSSSSGFSQFLKNVKALYAAALGIEILCIAAAEIGENTVLYLFGFNLIGIPIAYAMVFKRKNSS